LPGGLEVNPLFFLKKINTNQCHDSKNPSQKTPEYIPASYTTQRLRTTVLDRISWTDLKLLRRLKFYLLGNIVP